MFDLLEVLSCERITSVAIINQPILPITDT